MHISCIRVRNESHRIWTVPGKGYPVSGAWRKYFPIGTNPTLRHRPWNADFPGFDCNVMSTIEEFSKDFKHCPFQVYILLTKIITKACLVAQCLVGQWLFLSSLPRT
jgi:hypothetical protein